MADFRLGVSWDATSDTDHYVWRLASGSVLRTQAMDGTLTSEFMDPEEAFIAAIASCHLLSFVTEAARAGYSVSRYQDNPVGTLGKDEQGVLYMREVALRPLVKFAGEAQPDRESVEALHREARKKCFISHSVRSEIRITPL